VQRSILHYSPSAVLGPGFADIGNLEFRSGDTNFTSYLGTYMAQIGAQSTHTMSLMSNGKYERDYDDVPYTECDISRSGGNSRPAARS